ncbi:MAG: hypothetical protein ACQEQC_08645 [Elusimicrobiota bacterium]
MRNRVIATLVFIFSLGIKPGFASSIEGVENLGMGGVGTAIETPKAALYNPALLGLREKFSVTVFEMPITISNDMARAGMYIYKNMDNFSDFSNLSESQQDEILDLAEYDLNLKLGAMNPSFSSGPYPLYTGARWWDMWWGFNFYNEVHIKPELNVSQSLFIPTFDLTATADGIAQIPLVFRVQYLPWRLPGKFYAAIAPKYLARTKVEENRRSLADVEKFAEELQNKDLMPGTGYGLDLGFYYSLSDKWGVGGTVKNIPDITISYPEDKDEKIASSLDTGIAFRPGEKIALTADLKDIKIEDFSQASLFTKLHIGASMDLTRFFTLRTGLYQGYPTAGIGLGSFLNYAFYGREMGENAGDNPLWNHILSLSIRI